MYERGEQVVVEGYRGRRSVLTVWEDRGRGIVLTSQEGYSRLLAGDGSAPAVGFPKRDVRGKADATTPNVPTEPQPPPLFALWAIFTFWMVATGQPGCDDVHKFNSTHGYC